MALILIVFVFFSCNKKDDFTNTHSSTAIVHSLAKTGDSLTVDTIVAISSATEPFKSFLGSSRYTSIDFDKFKNLDNGLAYLRTYKDVTEHSSFPMQEIIIFSSKDSSSKHGIILHAFLNADSTTNRDYFVYFEEWRNNDGGTFSKAASDNYFTFDYCYYNTSGDSLSCYRIDKTYGVTEGSYEGIAISLEANVPYYGTPVYRQTFDECVGEVCHEIVANPEELATCLAGWELCVTAIVGYCLFVAFW